MVAANLSKAHVPYTFFGSAAEEGSQAASTLVRDAVGQRLTTDLDAIFHISFIGLIENNMANCHVGTLNHKCRVLQNSEKIK